MERVIFQTPPQPQCNEASWPVVVFLVFLGLLLFVCLFWDFCYIFLAFFSQPSQASVASQAGLLCETTLTVAEQALPKADEQVLKTAEQAA